MTDLRRRQSAKRAQVTHFIALRETKMSCCHWSTCSVRRSGKDNFDAVCFPNSQKTRCSGHTLQCSRSHPGVVHLLSYFQPCRPLTQERISSNPNTRRLLPCCGCAVSCRTSYHEDVKTFSKKCCSVFSVTKSFALWYSSRKSSFYSYEPSRTRDSLCAD